MATKKTATKKHTTRRARTKTASDADSNAFGNGETHFADGAGNDFAGGSKRSHFADGSHFA